MLNKNEIIKQIEKNKVILRDFGVKKIYLIGSYASDKATKHSDIDFVVSFKENRGLFDDYIHLIQFLQDLFKKDIDIGEEHLLREEIRDGILGGARVEAKI